MGKYSHIKDAGADRMGEPCVVVKVGEHGAVVENYDQSRSMTIALVDGQVVDLASDAYAAWWNANYGDQYPLD